MVILRDTTRGNSLTLEIAPSCVSRAAEITMMRRPPLVLGFGNILLGDDGAGIRVIERLRRELGSGGCDFIDAGTLSFTLLPYVEATDSLLVIDAAELAARPGTVALYEGDTMDSFLMSSRRRTVHEVGLIDLLDMARLQDSLPARRALICIQPEHVDWTEILSSPVAGGLTVAVEEARTLLARWEAA